MSERSVRETITLMGQVVSSPGARYNNVVGHIAPTIQTLRQRLWRQMPSTPKSATGSAATKAENAGAL